MEALGLEKTEISVCEQCEYRFFCFTTRYTPIDGLCSEIGFGRLSEEAVKLIHIAKAKRQGHYYPPSAG